MLAQHGPVDIDYLAWPALGPVADELAVVAVGYEAYLLAVRLVGDREASFGGDRADIALGVLANGEQEPPKLFLAQGEEDVGLVLAGVRALEQVKASWASL